MQGFTPPNPYGSFFNFADPAVMAQQSFTANPAGTLSPGTLSAMGVPVGGFNPSLAEWSNARFRDTAYQQFIARSLSTDPTTRTFSNVAMDLLFKDKAERSAAAAKYGQSNIDAMVGMALNMPGVSQFFGGSARSLALGALGAGTSGMRWNNTGMFGDGQVQLMGATKVLDMVRQNFYTSSGAQRLDMTQGLNKDQIGAILAAGGAQGAFAGLDMGKIGATGKMTWNEGSLEKIKNFTKSAAKAISGLIDIYGDANFNELYDKVQRITGLDYSQRGNADIIQQRLQNLRNTSRIAGIDPATLMDMSAGTVNFGVGMGFSRSYSGAIAANIAGPAAWQYQMSRQTAGTFFQPSRSLATITGEMATSAMGMTLDPLGARRNAIELMIQQGMISGDAATAARQFARDATPGTTGRLDAFISQSAGVYLPNFIRRMGGARQMANLLSSENQNKALEANLPDLQRRGQSIMERNMTGVLQEMGGGAIGQLGNFQKLMNNLDPTTVYKLLGAVDKGGNLDEIIKSNLTGSLDVAAYHKAAASIGAAFPGRAQGLSQLFENIKIANVHTRNLMSADELSQQSRASFYAFGGVGPDKLAALQGVAMNARGQMRGTILQGFLDRFGGTDPASVLAVALSTAGGQANITHALSKNKKDWFMSSFDLSPEHLTGVNGVRELTGLREIMKGMPGGVAALEAAGLMERGMDKHITPELAAKFATRFATDPTGALPGMSGIGTGRGRLAFANTSYLQNMKDNMEGLNTLTKMKGYFSSKKPSDLNVSLTRLLSKLQDSTIAGRLDTGQLYDALTAQAFIANLDPEAMEGLARSDARFADKANATLSGMKPGASEKDKMETLADILQKAGVLTGGYQLVGKVTEAQGGYDVTGVKLESLNKKK